MENPIKDAIAVAKSENRFLRDDEVDGLTKFSSYFAINVFSTNPAYILRKREFFLLSINAANILRDRAKFFIEIARQSASIKFPDLNCIPEFPKKFDTDIRYCLRLIQYCLLAGDVSPIIESELANSDKLPSFFTLSPRETIAALNYIKTHHGLTEMAAFELDRHIDFAIYAIAKLADTEDNRTEPRDVPNIENGEILTLEEIYQQYPDQWVLIVSPELDEELNVIRGQVLAHSSDRDEVYDRLSLRKGKPLAIEYTGTTENIAIAF